GKRCEKNYSSVRRYVADPDNAYPKRSITKLILKGAVIFDVVSYQFRCALNYSKLVSKDDVDLLVRVDDLVVDLGVGVEDLTRSVGLVELMVEREVGVDDLEGMFEVGLEVVLELVLVVELGMGLVAELDMGLDDAANVGRPAGVAGLPAGLAGLPLEETGLEPGPPEEEGLRSPVLIVFNL
ncbi:hypothetical protein Tco_0027199, partial [Tanacetum coccineum]